jgi:hypothetical protein
MTVVGGQIDTSGTGPAFHDDRASRAQATLIGQARDGVGRTQR